MPSIIGSVLLSNTLICEVSRLFSEDDKDSEWYPNSALRIIDLMTLIDAVVLHDTIYTLPCIISEDEPGLEVRNLLIGRGILQDLDTSTAHTQLSAGILQSLASVKPIGRAGPSSGLAIDFKHSVEPMIEEFYSLQEGKKSPTLKIDDAGTGYLAGATGEILAAESFEEAAMSLIGWLEYQVSGAYGDCTSILRDMYYIYASEYFQLPYWPQFTRNEFARKFPNYFHESFRAQLYTKVAEAFRVTVSEIYEDVAPQVTFIPPFSTQVFERSASRNDIVDQIYIVRDEYTKLRTGLAEIESERQTARSIKERKAIREKQKMLLGSAAKAFDHPHTISLEGIIRYIPEVVGPATAPLDPSKYSANLILQPLEWLLNWWTRRPISKLFDLGRQIERIKDYEQLAVRLFGEKAKQLSTLQAQRVLPLARPQ